MPLPDELDAQEGVTEDTPEPSILDKVRAKYPAYAAWKDQDLAKALAQKYPAYQPYLTQYLQPLAEPKPGIGHAGAVEAQDPGASRTTLAPQPVVAPPQEAPQTPPPVAVQSPTPPPVVPPAATPQPVVGQAPPGGWERANALSAALYDPEEEDRQKATAMERAVSGVTHPLLAAPTEAVHQIATAVTQPFSAVNRLVGLPAIDTAKPIFQPATEQDKAEMSPLRRFFSGSADFLKGMSSIDNALTLALFAKLPVPAQQAGAAVFEGAMVGGGAEKGIEALKAATEGNWGKAAELAGTSVASIGMGGGPTALEAVKTGLAAPKGPEYIPPPEPSALEETGAKVTPQDKAAAKWISDVDMSPEDVPPAMSRKIAARRNISGLLEMMDNVESAGGVGRWKQGTAEDNAAAVYGQEGKSTGIKSPLPEELQGNEWKDLRRAAEQGMSGKPFTTPTGKPWAKGNTLWNDLESWALKKDGPIDETDLQTFLGEQGVVGRAAPLDDWRDDDGGRLAAAERAAIQGEAYGGPPVDTPELSPDASEAQRAAEELAVRQKEGPIRPPIATTGGTQASLPMTMSEDFGQAGDQMDLLKGPASTANQRTALIAGAKVGPPSDTPALGRAGMTARLKEINNRLSNEGQAGPLDVPLSVGRVKGQMSGFFRPATGELRIKLSDDVETLAHEIAHHLDENTGLADAVRSDMTLSAEAEQNAYPNAKDPIVEGIAEVAKYWMTDPTHAQKFAPNIVQALENTWYAHDPEGFAMAQGVRDAYSGFKAEPIIGRVMANIKTNPAKYTPPPTSLDGTGNFAGWWYRVMRDTFNRDEAALRFSKMGRPVPARFDPWVMVNRMRNLGDRAKQWWNLGAVDPGTFNKIEGSRGLFQVMGDVGPDRFREFEAYQNMRTALDRATNNPTEKRLAGAKTFMDMNGAGSRAQLAQAVADAEARHPDFKQADDGAQTWDHQLLDYAVGRGALSSLEANRMKANLYTPWYRVMEQGGGVPGAGEIRMPFRGLKGSEREMISPTIGRMKNTLAVLHAVDRAELMRSFIEKAKTTDNPAAFISRVAPDSIAVKMLVEDARKAIADALGEDYLEGMTEEDLQTMAVFWRADLRGSPMENVIAYRNPNQGMNAETGLPNPAKTELYQVDPELWRLTQAAGSGTGVPDVLGATVMGALGLIGRGYRFGVVATPEFWIGRSIREAIAGDYVNTGRIPGKTESIGIGPAMRSVGGRFDPDYFRFVASGASQASIGQRTMQALGKMRDKALDLQGPGIKLLSSPFGAAISAADAMSHIMEETSRLGIFKQREAQPLPQDVTPGDQAMRAATEARHSRTDFAQRGASEFLNKWQTATAFMRPMMQASWRTAQAAIDNPDRFMYSSGIQAAMVLGAFKTYEDGDEDVKRVMDSMPESTRNSYYIFGFKIAGKPHVLGFPVPWQTGVIAKIFEKWLDALRTSKPMDYGNVMKAVGGMLTPNLLPTGPSMAAEEALDYSFFLGRHLTPDYLKDKPAPEQFTDYTSEIAKRLGWATGVSPIKIDNIVQATNLGRDLAKVTDKLSDYMGKQVRPASTISDTLVVGRFFPRVNREDAQQVRDFREFHRKAAGFVSALQSAFKSNPMSKDAQNAAAQGVLERNPDLAAYPPQVYVAAADLAKNLSEMGLLKRAISMAPPETIGGLAEQAGSFLGLHLDYAKESPAEIKRQLIDGVNTQMTIQAGRFNSVLQDYTRGIQKWGLQGGSLGFYAKRGLVKETIGQDAPPGTIQPLAPPDPAMQEAVNGQFQGVPLQGVANTLAARWGLKPHIMVKTGYGNTPSQTDRMPDGSYQITLHPGKAQPWAVHHEMRHVLEDLGGQAAEPHDNNALAGQMLEQEDPLTLAAQAQLTQRPYRQGMMFWDMAQKLRAGEDISEWAAQAGLTPTEGRQVGLLASLKDKTGLLNMLTPEELQKVLKATPEDQRAPILAILRRHRHAPKRFHKRIAGAV